MSLLGIDTIRTLVLSINVFSQFDQDKLSILDIGRMWKHSLRVGLFAKAIARAENQSQNRMDDVLTTGLLHDVGKLVLATNFPKEYADIARLAEKERVTIGEAEASILDGTTHAEVGAYLMGLWGLPRCIIEAIAFHHRPDSDMLRSFSVMLAIYIANLLQHDPETACLESTFPGSRLPAWKEACKRITDSEDQDA